MSGLFRAELIKLLKRRTFYVLVIVLAVLLLLYFLGYVRLRLYHDFVRNETGYTDESGRCVRTASSAAAPFATAITV